MSCLQQTESVRAGYYHAVHSHCLVHMLILQRKAVNILSNFCWQVACDISSLSLLREALTIFFYLQVKFLSAASDDHLLFANDSKSRSMLRS